MRYLWVSVLLILAGCEAPRSTPQLAVSPPGMVCEQRKVTGSNRVQRVCRTREQAEWERQQAEDLLRRSKRSVTPVE